MQPKNIFFRFVSVFRTSQNNRNKQNFLETNRKNLQKMFFFRGSSKPLIFFLGSNRNELKLNLFRLFFGLLFCKTQKIFSRLFRCFGLVWKQPKQTELMVWVIKKVDILPNLLLFRLIFVLFWLFRNTETPCSDIKAKQLKQTSCFG